jgi:ABC-type Mn2+/Zn2+ transport system ATPase subunit
VTVYAKQTESNEPALDVRSLSAGYPDNPLAIEDVTFTVRRGERVAVVGPNGAGKSTLFKAIAGLIPFASGEISVDGEDCRSSHAHIGYVPQRSEIDWSFPITVYDTIMMGRVRYHRWLPWFPAADHERVRELMARMSLTDLARKPIAALSGGQQRRVFIARALAQDTSILLMDEPFTGVDTTAEAEIMRLLDMLTQEGITILLATHDLGRAARDYDRVMLIKNRIRAYGDADVVMVGDVLRAVYGPALRVVRDGGDTLFIADEHGHGA